ncbi:heavy metal transport/detoxification protein [Haladaptatus sp. R4]|uniref:heavy-metal-associated domain-containing protein n=1 Tax=Haladaptatus sp. R4 TaxID=1679489 RepID=UPI0007B4C272|nr:heavy-metal-associated domain-containing protein [Haladaptatus sp. R4]KZN24625.1 heavy metal transport/detoxification protein [Haladaptatus sp. R4]
MERYTLRVIGMSCKSCENIVRSEVTGLRGVSSVDPDARANEVVVQGEPATESRVRQAITEIGYDVAE